MLVPKVTGSEDFSFFQRIVPGLVHLRRRGTAARGSDSSKAAPNHSPRFFIDEASLVVGVRALANLTCDYLESTAGNSAR